MLGASVKTEEDNRIINEFFLKGKGSKGNISAVTLEQWGELASKLSTKLLHYIVENKLNITDAFIIELERREELK